MLKCTSLESATDKIFEHFLQRGQQKIRFATPLGLGKPNQLINTIYNRVKADKALSLDIYTALSLDIPQAKSELEDRFLKPFIHRQWGDYPRLQYLIDLNGGSLPPQINLHEFYVNAGAFKHNPYVQRHYRSLNYTHVAQNLADLEVEMIVQLIARRGDSYSLSVNSDLTLDIIDRLKAKDKTLYMVGVVHHDLPFLGGDARVEPSFFDLILDSPETQHKLFAVPREALTEVDTVIGLHSSQIVEDGGTLQIGIGSLSDSLVQALLHRHKANDRYRALCATFARGESTDDRFPCQEKFQEGLYGTSEMVMDGFMYLRQEGILKRKVREKGGDYYLHAAFALGSSKFYDWLRSLKGDDFEGFSMTRVSNVNDLYDADENSLRRQRRKARFFNTCMQVTLLGAAASETLDDGTIISGVGGQYNFVAMAHELEGARSILMLRSTSIRDGKKLSNIVWNHGNVTIPRHLRDVVITEYGIAFLRGKSDEEVIKDILNICDSEFQLELMTKAKHQLKLSLDYEIPERYRHNHRSELKKNLDQHPWFFQKFPFGSDFTEQELRLAKALLILKEAGGLQRFRLFLSGLLVDKRRFAEDLSRMGFGQKLLFKERVLRTVLLASLAI